MSVFDNQPLFFGTETTRARSETSLGGGLIDPRLAEGPIDFKFVERLFDYTPSVVFFLKNRLGRYLVVNETLVRRCGLASKDQLLGRTVCDVFPPQLAASYAEQDQLVLETGLEIRDRLELHLYPNRTWGWCLTLKLPLRDLHGRVVGMAGISKDLEQPDTEEIGYRAVARAVEYIQQHFAEPLRIEDVARTTGLSVPRFARLVYRIFGLTPRQLLIRTRLEAASQMLVSGMGSVTDVAHACGYSDHSAFTRQFKVYVGLTPLAFRRIAHGMEEGCASNDSKRSHVRRPPLEPPQPDLQEVQREEERSATEAAAAGALTKNTRSR